MQNQPNTKLGTARCKKRDLTPLEHPFLGLLWESLQAASSALQKTKAQKDPRRLLPTLIPFPPPQEENKIHLNQQTAPDGVMCSIRKGCGTEVHKNFPTSVLPAYWENSLWDDFGWFVLYVQGGLPLSLSQTVAVTNVKKKKKSSF